tara:strand:- start:761 stop:1345 length:585 start_codon:yes stop_codon:yes gene_type:complete
MASFGRSTQAMKSSIKLMGAKEIADMFGDLPKQINQYSLWKALWREIGKPALNDAKRLAPILGDSGKADAITKAKGVIYPPDPSKRIAKGTLKKSIGFFTTKNSRGRLGLYLGPRVKRAYAKNKGGYYGAWLEYGNDVIHFGKYTSKATPFMTPAWNRNKIKMTTMAFSKAGNIVAKAIKRHEKRMQKYGTLGY